MQILDQQISRFYSVNGQEVPPEGPRAIPLKLDFSGTDTYDLNLQNMQARAFISMIQAVWVDNRNNASPLDIIVPNTGQVVRTAPGHQGYKMVLCPNPAVLQFVTQGGVTILVTLLNYPVTNSDWATA